MNVTQHMLSAFAARHITGRCNWVIEAAGAILSGEAPDWCPISEQSVEEAWDAMRTCRAELAKEQAAINYRAEGIAIAHERMKAADLETDYEGSTSGARDLAESVRELSEQIESERDECDDASAEWERLDFAAGVLLDYADALESAADEPDEPEVFQAFYVSDWLAHFLSDRYEGEGIIEDDDGNSIWLRQCCGQAAWMDPCIEAAAREWYTREGDGPAWTAYAYALESHGSALLDAVRGLLESRTIEGRVERLREVAARIESMARGEA